MVLVRTMLILVLGLATALFGAGAEEFATGGKHPHPAAVEIAASGDQDGNESSHDIVQSCHQLQGLELFCDAYDEVYVSADGNRFFATDISMTDASLSGPLKPPRFV